MSAITIGTEDPQKGALVLDGIDTPNSESLLESKTESAANAALDIKKALSIEENRPQPASHYYSSPLLDLSNPEVLKTYLAPDLQKKIQVCTQIARRIYEVPHRGMADNNYGMAFPMDPEILAYAMQLVRNEIVIELAGAHGENSILLASAGASRVFMNDIQLDEMATFRALCEQLPRNISSRLTPIEGSCFEVLEKKPELAESVGLVLCRNLIHFFSDEAQTRLFETIKAMLKPGGLAIFETNSIYPTFEEDGRVFEENPDATCFTTTQCLVTDYRYGGMPRAIIFRELTPSPEHLLSDTYTAQYLYKRGKETQGKWKVDNDTYMKLDDRIRPLIKQAIENNKGALKTIKAGTVRVLTSGHRIYNTQTLSALFRNHGFTVEHVYVVGQNGHLVEEPDIFKKGQQVGAIVRYN